LEVNKKIDSLSKQKNYSYEIIDLKNEEGELLKELNVYIVKLMTYLWDQPKLIANLLLSAEKNDIKENLAPLIANNFYENILSSDYIEDNLLYILSLLLQKEIDDLNSENDFSNFLNETPCGFLLGHLKEKKDVQTFFKMIIIKAVEKLEGCCSNKDLLFSIGKIDKDIQRQENKGRINDLNDSKSFFLKMTKKKSDIIRSSVDNRDVDMDLEFDSELEKSSKSIIFESKIFKEKYFCCLTKEKIIEEKERYKNENKSDDENQIENINKMFDIYINKMPTGEKENRDVVEHYLSNKDKYDNEEFLNGLDTEEKIKKVYIDNFYRVLETINTIFANIFDNLYLLPYSIKCLCKIISILIKKKFHGLSNTEENSFIAKFFFCKLFAPIFKNPATFALINKYIISGKTKHNLEVITPIILQLVSGRLYRNGGKHSDYTPFNWFFLEEMPYVIKFFDYITNKVKLPNFIEKFLNDQLDENYKYNYFEENPEEVICHRSICFNINDISYLLENMKNCQSILFPQNNKNTTGLQKTYEKLYNNKANQEIIKELRNTKVYDKNESLNKENELKSPIINYYLVTDFIYNDKYKHLFLLEQKTPHYSIKELKDIQNNEENIQNNLIKVKNYLNTLLYNYRTLVKTDFEEGTTFDLKNILKELKIFMKSSNFVIDGSIPSEWYINSIIEYLNKIPEEYIKNDYELLFDSIEKEVNESINKLDFEILSICLDKMKYIRKNIIYYDNAKEILIDILLNNKVNKIIEEDKIKVELSFTYEKDKKELSITKYKKSEKQLQFLDNMIFQNINKKGTKVCKSIEIFTKYFPNLIELLSKEDGKDIFDIQKELNLPQKLSGYFDIIKEYLIKEKKIKDQKLSELINEKIYDYVMNKIYDRIFPKEPSKIDIDIYERAVSLAWIEPRHIIPEKTNYVYDTFLPDVINNFYLLDKNKSPRIKFKNMSNIFMIITNIVKFNNIEKEDIGVDDLIPILNYSVIKAQPLKLYSNCKFMELYIGNLKNKNEDNQLTQLQSICMRIKEINHNNLIDVDVREFENKCFQFLYDKINSVYKD
jgi:hypothetical protein